MDELDHHHPYPNTKVVTMTVDDHWCSSSSLSTRYVPAVTTNSIGGVKWWFNGTPAAYSCATVCSVRRLPTTADTQWAAAILRVIVRPTPATATATATAATVTTPATTISDNKSGASATVVSPSPPSLPLPLHVRDHGREGQHGDAHWEVINIAPYSPQLWRTIYDVPPHHSNLHPSAHRDIDR